MNPGPGGYKLCKSCKYQKNNNCNAGMMAGLQVEFSMAAEQTEEYCSGYKNIGIPDGIEIIELGYRPESFVFETVCTFCGTKFRYMAKNLSGAKENLCVTCPNDICKGICYHNEKDEKKRYMLQNYIKQLVK